MHERVVVLLVVALTVSACGGGGAVCESEAFLESVDELWDLEGCERGRNIAMTGEGIEGIESVEVLDLSASRLAAFKIRLSSGSVSAAAKGPDSSSVRSSLGEK